MSDKYFFDSNIIETKPSFWDSLILSAAVSAGCSVLYSEDLNDGQTVRGVTIHNPFEH